jgi:hypothetical protein
MHIKEVKNSKDHYIFEVVKIMSQTLTYRRPTVFLNWPPRLIKYAL